MPGRRSDVVRLEVKGGENYTTARSLRVAFNKIGFNAEHAPLKENADNHEINFVDMIPTLELVRKVIEDLPVEKRELISAYGSLKHDL